MLDLDFPSDYISEIEATQQFNLEKVNITLISQEGNTVYIKFNYQLFPLYKGNSLSLTDQLNNTYYGFIDSIDTYNESAVVIICHNNATIPNIIKVEYYEWWSNQRPSATILNYIFINEENG